MNSDVLHYIEHNVLEISTLYKCKHCIFLQEKKKQKYLMSN